MKEVTMVAGWLLVVSGLNVGVRALTGSDLLGSVLGQGSSVTQLVDLAVGASALLAAYNMVGKKK